MAVSAADIQGMPSGEFASVSDATILAYITEAEARLDSGTWGAKYDLGVKYLAAHELAVDISGGMGAAGPVISESAGPLSRSYAASALFSASNASNLNATSYGRKFQQLRNELGIMGFIA